MQSRKTIITVSGVILFLLAGSVTMFMQPSESPAPTPAPQQSAQLTPQTPPPVPTPQAEPQNDNEPVIWYVYVTGEVAKPGIVTLSEGARVFHAVDAAGGFTKDADTAAVNLAAVLADQTQIHVPAKSEQNRPQLIPNNPPQVVRVPGVASGIRSPASGLVDINRADLQELQRINGVGPAIAQRIIDYRNAHGAFSSVEDLINVKGIGNARLNQIRSQVTLSGGSSYYTAPNTTRPNTNTNTNSGLIDINHANLQELQRIKGVGATTAQRIIDYRNQHGTFSQVEDLLNVRGIGASKLKQIRSQVVIR